MSAIGSARARRYFFLFALTLAALAAGCAVTKEISRAQYAVEAARAGHADYLAPYEFTSADIYLKEAKAQANRSDFARAVRCAVRASDFAASSAALAKTKFGTSSAQPLSTAAAAASEAQGPAFNSPDGFGDRIRRLQKEIEAVKLDNARVCAPRELASAEAHLAFAQDDLDSRSYLSCSNRLPLVESNLDQIRAFIGECRGNAQEKKEE